MTNETAHEYMENEIRCIQRASNGICTRDCGKCDLVKMINCCLNHMV